MKRCTRIFARSLYLLVYLVVGGRGNHDDDLGLEDVPRTLTFDSYYRNPLYKPMRPVYVSEVDVVSYIPDRIVTLQDRLIVGPTSKPVIKGVYHRLRTGENRWTEVDPERAKLLFDFSSDPQHLALLVNLTALSDVYEPLGAIGAPRYFDPWPNSTMNLLPQPSIAEQRGIFATQIQRFREDKAHKANESKRARQSLDKLMGRLFPSASSVHPGSVLDVGYDEIAASFERHGETWVASQLIFDFALLLELTGPSTRPHNVGKVQRLDLTIVPRVRRSRPTSVLCTPGVGSDTVSPSLAEGLPFQKAGDLSNLGPSDSDSNPKKKSRGAHPAAATGVGYSSCQLEADFNNLAASSHPPPETGHTRCERPTGAVRAAGAHLASWRTRLSSPDFEQLHPEEAFWIRRRLDRTSGALAEFVAQHLPGKRPLQGEEARLRVGVVHGGEGKRGALHSMGVASSLFSLGVYNSSTWVGASSGSAWFLASWYAMAKHRHSPLPPPSLLFETLKPSLRRCALTDEFDANEALTDFFNGLEPYHAPLNEGRGSDQTTEKPTSPSPKARATGARTDKVLCDAELRLNALNALEGLQGLPSFFEYLTRALAMQFLDPVNPRGVSETLSGLAADPLLADAHLPLPLFQLQEGGEVSSPASASVSSLWCATPFDISTHTRDLHASFPTHLLGSSALPSSSPSSSSDKDGGSGLLTQYMDTLPFLASLSSHLLPRLRNQTWAGVLCGAHSPSSSSSAHCGPLRLNNPFWNFAPLQANGHDPSLFHRDHVAFADHGGPQALPVWPLVTHARKADVLIASDASGGRQSPSFGPTPSTPNKAASLGPLNCALDRNGADCPSPLGPSLSPNSSCCDVCKGPEADINGCWPSDDPDSHPLFSLPHLGPGHSLPPLPSRGEDIRPLLNKVSFFGCTHVSGATAIVYIPHFIATSGVGGHPALKGVLNYNIPAASEQRYTASGADKVVHNAMHSVPNGVPFQEDQDQDKDSVPLQDKEEKKDAVPSPQQQQQQRQPPLAKCLACLYYAKATGDDGFMADDLDCRECYDAYCYTKPFSSSAQPPKQEKEKTAGDFGAKEEERGEEREPLTIGERGPSELISEPWEEGEGVDLDALSTGDEDEDYFFEDTEPLTVGERGPPSAFLPLEGSSSGLIDEPWEEGEAVDPDLLHTGDDDEDYFLDDDDEDEPPSGRVVIEPPPSVSGKKKREKLTLQEAMASRPLPPHPEEARGRGGFWQDIEEMEVEGSKRARDTRAQGPGEEWHDHWEGGTHTGGAAAGTQGNGLPSGSGEASNGEEASNGLPSSNGEPSDNGERLDQAGWAFASKPSKPQDGLVWQAPDDSEFNFNFNLQQAPPDGDTEIKIKYRGVEVGGTTAHEREQEEAEVLAQQVQGAGKKAARAGRGRKAVGGRRRRARRETTGK